MKHYYQDPEYWSDRATWDGVATDGWSPRLNDFFYSIKRRYLSEHLHEVPRYGTVLEVGCGVGRIGVGLSEMRKDISLVGLDFSRQMLRMADKTGVYDQLIEADITAIPIRSEAFDLALAMDVLFHVVRPEMKGSAWMELARVVKDENGIAAYNSAHEITSLVWVDRAARKLIPWNGLFREIRDRLTVFSTRVFDST